MRQKESDRCELEGGLIGEQRKNLVFALVFAAATALLLGGHILIWSDYPYYFIWDMDHITCLDTVLIQSGLLPDHICHPGFGMYLPLFFSEKIGHFWGAVSALDLGDVAGSLNPLAAMAELTDFVRLHSPFLSVGIALFLSLAVRLIFRLSRWYLLLFFVFLGLQESLVYHSSMIRTELYSVFYWSGAILAMAVAVQAGSSVRRYVGLLATGVLLGLSFMTKVQSLLHLAVVPVLLVIVFYFVRGERTQSGGSISRKSALWLMALSFFNVVAFLVLGIASYSTPILRGVPTWAAAFRVTPTMVLFSLALLSVLVCQLFLYLSKKLSSEVFALSCLLSVVAAGFLLSFALFFLLYSDVALSLQYILLSFKIAFLRVPKLLRVPEPSDYISNLLLYLRYNPVLFIVSIGLNVLLVFGYLRRFVRITKGQLLLCLFATVLALVNVIVMTRYKLRDIIWEEVLLNFLNLFFFGILVSRAQAGRLILARAGGVLLICLMVVNCIHVYDTPDRIDANYTQYGWQADKFFTAVYGRNQRKYSEIMRQRYNKTTAWVAKAKAVDHRRIRRTVDFVFKNQKITHRNIGVVFEGFSVWSSDLNYRIAEAPQAIRGSILVDNGSVGLRKRVFFKEEHVREHSDYMDKFKKASSGGRISVLTRPDLRIFLFLDAGDVSGLLSEQVVESSYRIVLEGPAGPIELDGLEIKNYCQISLDKFSDRFFFVIRQM